MHVFDPNVKPIFDHQIRVEYVCRNYFFKNCFAMISQSVYVHVNVFQT